jgi:aldehyde dehydrogenase (NAD+)
VAPAATIAQVEIFGPVLVSLTFRTPAEAVALANNTPYGLAASVWSENINLALDVAPKLKAGVVWVNATNLFDAAAGFGGYRESGFGREGGREGMYEYLRPAWERAAGRRGTAAQEGGAGRRRRATARPVVRAAVDRTPKLFIGGKQRRPDGGYSRKVLAPDGSLLGEVGEGNRKDVRDAVEAAHAAAGWGRGAGHARAQVLYYVAENLAARAADFAARIDAMTGAGRGPAGREVDLAVARLFTYAAWADKWDGAVHQVPIRGVTLAMHEPVGVLGLVAPELPSVLGLVSLVAPAVALGNTVVLLPSTAHPLAATDFYAVLETSDLPAGVVNIVTGDRRALAAVLAEHFDVDGMWFFGGAEDRDAVRTVEAAAAGNMKRTWCSLVARDWAAPVQGEGREFLRRATEVKNIWIPYGE